MSKILVMGGDGFCGWATALHLADQEVNGKPAHQVTILDNFSRRRIDTELGVESLTPISSMTDRLKAWTEVAGKAKSIDFVELDAAKDFDGLVKLLLHLKPDTVIHFAEQRSAPYSMKNETTGRYTISNNSKATTNLLIALAFNKSELDPHIIHLGTMGVYGYGRTGKLPIPEGYLMVTVTTPDGDIQELEIVHPDYAGSVYHETKSVDHNWFQAYHRMYGLRITDLHQGIVWGTQTEQTSKDIRLINRFDYDGDYGTVLNRFLMQAAIGYPMTVHGTGGQTRAFINIQDTVRCVELAVLNPPKSGEKPRVYNQMTETQKVIDLAKHIKTLTGIDYKLMTNPRKEAEKNDLVVVHNHLIDLGLKPKTISDDLLEEITSIAKKYAKRADKGRIPATLSTWEPKKK